MFSEWMIFHTCSKKVRQRDSHLSLGMFAKLQKATVSFILSVCQYGTDRLPLDIFSWNIIFEDFSKICFENSSLIKNLTGMTGTLHEDVDTFMISQWILHRMINASSRSCKENQNIHFMFSNPPLWKLCHLWDNVEKFGRARQAAHDKVMLRIKICLVCQTTKARLEAHTHNI